MIYLGRKNNKGKKVELTDFSYLLSKDNDKSIDDQIEKNDTEKEN